MKTYLSLLLLLITGIAKSQVSIPIEQYHGANLDINNAYFEDVNGLLNRYVGTWEYSNGPHFFKVRLIKKPYVKVSPPGYLITRYADIIYGYYQYKFNGVEVYNTFPSGHVLAEQIYETTFVHSSGGVFTINGFEIYYREPTLNPCGRDRFGSVKLEHSVIGGVETLHWDREDKIEFIPCRHGAVPDETPFKVPALMTLTKVD